MPATTVRSPLFPNPHTKKLSYKKRSQIGYVQKSIKNHASKIDKTEGNNDKHEVLNKALKEMNRISFAFSHDDVKFVKQLRSYLQVVKSDLASAVAIKKAEELHTKYSMIKNKYFMLFPDNKLKKN